MIRLRFLPIVLSLVLPAITAAVTASAARPAHAKTNGLEILPRPTKVAVSPGTFLLKADTTIFADPAMRSTAEQLAEILHQDAGLSLKVQPLGAGGTPAGAVIVRSDASLARLGGEGYTLSIEPKDIVIRAVKPAGAFYACQTLRQLLPPRSADRSAPFRIHCAKILDHPRFVWRGLMLDPARYFLPIPLLKRYVDILALLKMNRLHLHLTDNEAWTIQIHKYPQLTDMKLWPMRSANRNRGIYTQAQLRGLVAYAARRHVMIIPEIEMPAHNAVVGWVLRDKVLCVNNPYRDRKKAWNKSETYKWLEPCVASPETTRVYENILREVMNVFPGPYIHLGGDEYFGLAWSHCPNCQKLLHSPAVQAQDTPELRRLFSHCRGSKDKYLLYRVFMTRMCNFVSSHGRQPVLWDDLSWQGHYPDKAVVMQWHYRGGRDYMQMITTPVDPAVEAVKAGHQAVIAPFNTLYFDLSSTLRQVFNLDPMPAGLTPAQSREILGPSAPVWNQPPSRLDQRVFPRVYALAEIGWSSEKGKDFEGFLRRCARLEARLGGTLLPEAGQTIGQWTPGEMAPDEKRVTLDWNATAAMKTPGTYRVSLNYQAGMDGVDIDYVALLENGKQIDRDTHKGWSGSGRINNVYRLKLPVARPGATYTIRAELQSRGGTDSRGVVTVQRVRPH